MYNLNLCISFKVLANVLKLAGGAFEVDIFALVVKAWLVMCVQPAASYRPRLWSRLITLTISRFLTQFGIRYLSAPKCQRFVAARCGFPKNLAFQVSRVLEQDVYGDDACFIANHCTADVIGVADGVGGWRNYGVDPSRFSRRLMASCARLVREGRFIAHRPAQLLAASYQEVTRGAWAPSSGGGGGGGSPERPLNGSSTACIVILDRRSSEVHTANLGDSGFLVVRQGRVVHRSQEQQHYFNAPFQLTVSDDAVGQFFGDSPDSAETSTFRVELGDCIVVATDGLFDNLPASLIENELSKLESFEPMEVQRACNSLAFQARLLSFDRHSMSPFAKKAQEHGIQAIGGKPDDITIILAVVASAESEEEDEEEVEASEQEC
ncbi:Protein phosphatase PTC7 -like protein [Trichinella zimbabwensis]|uniref:Protein phosphatase n=1 Tax=Trichinella zimbabwensis TaxID=268475 RepID=A0A0V1I6Q7_9BILA|nr:Protein phosphatase PTC7 -like protein [Trichinella zimbabwensis]